MEESTGMATLKRTTLEKFRKITYASRVRGIYLINQSKISV